MKVVVSHSIGEEIWYCGGFLSQEEDTYVIYMAIANLDEPYHITPEFLRKNIKYSADLLKFNYEIIFNGRQFYNKLDRIPQHKIESLLKKRIEFLNPTDILIPEISYDLSNNIINYAVKNMYSDSGINIFEYGKSEGSYNYFLTNEAIKRKSLAGSSFAQLLPKTPADPLETYKVHKLYNEVPNIRKE